MAAVKLAVAVVKSTGGSVAAERTLVYHCGSDFKFAVKLAGAGVK